MSKSRWVTRTTLVDKPWGSEEHFAVEDGKYCGKILRINAGHSLSLQLHRHKDETVAVQTGLITIEIGYAVDALDRFQLEPGEVVHIAAGMIHRMEAVLDSVVLEASTTELDDVVRVADRYGRTSEPVA